MSKNVTDKYSRMLSAFDADFQLALKGEHKLSELNNMIEKNNEKLIHDIDLLNELADGIRYGKVVIREFTTIDHNEEKE